MSHTENLFLLKITKNMQSCQEARALRLLRSYQVLFDHIKTNIGNNIRSNKYSKMNQYNEN